MSYPEPKAPRQRTWRTCQGFSPAIEVTARPRRRPRASARTGWSARLTGGDLCQKLQTSNSKLQGNSKLQASLKIGSLLSSKEEGGSHRDYRKFEVWSL